MFRNIGNSFSLNRTFSTLTCSEQGHECELNGTTKRDSLKPTECNREWSTPKKIQRELHFCEHVRSYVGLKFKEKKKTLQLENFYCTWNVTLMVVDLFKSRLLGASCSNSEHRSSHVHRKRSLLATTCSFLHSSFPNLEGPLQIAFSLGNLCRLHVVLDVSLFITRQLLTQHRFFETPSGWYCRWIDDRQKFFEWPVIFILSIDLHSQLLRPRFPSSTLRLENFADWTLSLKFKGKVTIQWIGQSNSRCAEFILFLGGFW